MHQAHQASLLVPALALFPRKMRIFVLNDALILEAQGVRTIPPMASLILLIRCSSILNKPAITLAQMDPYSRSGFRQDLSSVTTRICPTKWR